MKSACQETRLIELREKLESEIGENFMKTQNKRKHFWFVKIPTELLFDDGVSAEEKVLYAAFHRYTSDKGEYYPWTFVGNRRLAFQLSIGEEKIERGLKSLNSCVKTLKNSILKPCSSS